MGENSVDTSVGETENFGLGGEGMLWSATLVKGKKALVLAII